MSAVTLRPADEGSWRALLRLDVQPDQLRFVAEYAPVAAIALAKAYIRPGGQIWEPYGIYAGDTPVGFVALAYSPASPEMLWVRHFFIDQARQGRGYGAAALAALLGLAQRRSPPAETLLLTVHPDNGRAQALYQRAGFQPTGARQHGEPIYALDMADLAG